VALGLILGFQNSGAEAALGGPSGPSLWPDLGALPTRDWLAAWLFGLGFGCIGWSLRRWARDRP